MFLGPPKKVALSNNRQKADIVHGIHEDNPSIQDKDELGDVAYHYSRVRKVDHLCQATVYRDTERNSGEFRS